MPLQIVVIIDSVDMYVTIIKEFIVVIITFTCFIEFRCTEAITEK